MATSKGFVVIAVTERHNMWDPKKELNTERVQQAYEIRPGDVDVETFWIAYGDDVLGYGAVDDRISRAAGRGPTRKAALADAVGIVEVS